MREPPLGFTLVCAAIIICGAIVAIVGIVEEPENGAGIWLTTCYAPDGAPVYEAVTEGQPKIEGPSVTLDRDGKRVIVTPSCMAMER